jgi:hypothetical protein
MQHVTKCKIRLFLVIITFLPLFTFGQRAVRSGSIAFLTYNQGFATLKLGSDITLLPKEKLSFLEGNDKADFDSCLTYQITDSLMVDIDGIIPLDAVCIRTYKNKIVNIYAFFSRNFGYAVLRSFITSYGLFTSKPDDYLDIYDWKSTSVDLNLRYVQTTSLGMATFTWNEINDKLPHRPLK